ncbi:hypothetical protein AYI70_g9199 [Smittium culicis]|uniref:Uncharacterized protein n=1 Tax=Smittium culicis TaxID=133412 RepID=A0A1R1XCG2_9FUNG|nr:hypothetical protein AYI70_g9199 [Smittium culicis]
MQSLQINDGGGYYRARRKRNGGRNQYFKKLLKWGQMDFEYAFTIVGVWTSVRGWGQSVADCCVETGGCKLLSCRRCARFGFLRNRKQLLYPDDKHLQLLAAHRVVVRVRCALQRLLSIFLVHIRRAVLFPAASKQASADQPGLRESAVRCWLVAVLVRLVPGIQCAAFCAQTLCAVLSAGLLFGGFVVSFVRLQLQYQPSRARLLLLDSAPLIGSSPPNHYIPTHIFPILSFSIYLLSQIKFSLYPFPLLSSLQFTPPFYSLLNHPLFLSFVEKMTTDTLNWSSKSSSEAVYEALTTNKVFLAFVSGTSHLQL